MTLLVTVALAGLWSQANYHWDSRYFREDSRAAADYLTSFARPDDSILVTGNGAALKHYWKREIPILNWKAPADASREEVEERFHELSETSGRLWLVVIRPWERDPEGHFKSILDSDYYLTRTQRFAGVEIFCYQLSRELARKPAEKAS